MRILPDGTVEIKNKGTGEVKIVQPADLPNYGISYTKYAAELESAKDIGIIGEKQVDPMEAISIAMREGGSEFINKGKTKDERSAIAQEIANMGGVSKYREALPLKDLLTEKEGEAMRASTDLKSKIDLSIPNFEKDVLGGTGPLAQFIPGFLRSPAGREKVANAGEITALYQQMISGKVVSDAEVKRLSQFLPNKNKTEKQNSEDLNRLKNRLDMNLELFDKAKREGLTPNEAYSKYAPEFLQKYGFQGGSSKTTRPIQQSQQTQQPTIQSPEDLMNKYWK